MSILPILTFDNPGLRVVADSVSPLEYNRYQKLIRDMLHTCKVAKGVGLAAPQVGVAKQIIVTNFRHPLVWINPKVVATSQEKLPPLPESCLSLPGKIVEVARYSKITVGFDDIHGNPALEELSGPLAVVLQHEIDHLNGILITDYLPKVTDDTGVE